MSPNVSKRGCKNRENPAFKDQGKGKNIRLFWARDGWWREKGGPVGWWAGGQAADCGLAPFEQTAFLDTDIHAIFPLFYGVDLQLVAFSVGFMAVFEVEFQRMDGTDQAA